MNSKMTRSRNDLKPDISSLFKRMMARFSF